ncbi:unnamed protein product, partial [Hymenolepis diminuta]|uniref:CASPASE_P20 domain-containing protein n=1 Tax=Hymenolepis diminuta TaxID=6216 RepID=A0A0R3SZ62_HYMDI
MRSPETFMSVVSQRSIKAADLLDPNLAYDRVDTPNNRSNPRGVCLLINQRDFHHSETRDGTDGDADIIEHTFRTCGYCVNRATNLTLRKMKNLLDRVGKQDHSKYDSFVCVILSHGRRDEIFASDKPIKVDYLISYFRSDRCPTLAGKPK